MTRHHEHESELETKGDMIHWAAGYDRLMNAITLGFEGRFRRRIIEAAGLLAGERVLDVGCGTGTLALLASEAVGDTGRVEGIDPSPEMIERARSKAEAKGSGVNFQVAAIEELPFEDDSFDVVLSTLMFHHLTRPLQQKGLDEMRRVLAPGGRIRIIDFDGGGPLFHRLAAHFTAHSHGDEDAKPASRGHRVFVAGILILPLILGGIFYAYGTAWWSAPTAFVVTAIVEHLLIALGALFFAAKALRRGKRGAVSQRRDDDRILGFDALAEEARERGFVSVVTDRFRPRALHQLRAEVPRGG